MELKDCFPTLTRFCGLGAEVLLFLLFGGMLNLDGFFFFNLVNRVFFKKLQTGFLRGQKDQFGYLKAKSINRKLFLKYGAKLENINNKTTRIY